MREFKKEQLEFIKLNKKELKASAKDYIVGHYRFLGTDKQGNMVAMCNDNASCFANVKSRQHIVPNNEHEGHSIIPNSFDPFAFITMDTGWEKTEANKAYINWVTKESPYKDAFLDDVPGDEFEPIHLSVDVSAPYMIGAAAILRHRRELPKVVKTWYKLVTKYNVLPEMAYVLANCIANYSATHFTVSYTSHGHELFNSAATGSSIKNFIKAKPSKSITGHVVSDRNYDYTGYWQVWGPLSSVGYALKMPEPDEPIPVVGWTNGGYSTGYKPIKLGFLWSKFDEFLASFIAMHNLEGAYEKTVSLRSRT